MQNHWRLEGGKKDIRPIEVSGKRIKKIAIVAFRTTEWHMQVE